MVYIQDLNRLTEALRCYTLIHGESNFPANKKSNGISEVKWEYWLNNVQVIKTNLPQMNGICM